MSIFNTIIKNKVKISFLIIFISIITPILFTIPTQATELDDAITSEAMTEETATEEAMTEESTTGNIAKTPFTIKKTIYHKHTGNSGGGGCYGKCCTGTRTVKVPCGGSMVYWPATDSSSCSRCGAGYHGDESGRKCWHSKTQTESYTYYDLNCGRGTSDMVGTVSLTKSEEEWTTSLTLTPSYENIAMQVNEQPYLYNGTQTAENSFSVSENGIYTLQLCADGNADTKSAEISMDIKNIDKWAPQIKTYSLLPTEWTNKGVTFEVTEVVDLQPDGTEGCGLHELSYSYDNGETWVAENTFLYMDNGTHTVMVRDKLENTSEITFEISNIDCLGPITEVDYDHTRNIPKTTLTITSTDIMEDGRDGCGLHDIPYSYDGGKTWTDKNILEIRNNGTIPIAVRDKLENITFLNVKITNIDATPPRVRHTLYPDYWTNQRVKVFFSAKDLQEDGEKGIGLDDKCFSYDNCTTWTDDNERDMYENGEVHVVVRDKNNNMNFYGIEVTNIDKICPTVTLNLLNDQSQPNNEIVLQAVASDSQSGISDNGYSWDGGNTYGSAKTLRVSDNGEYTVFVKDRAGNTASASLEVTSIPKKIFQKQQILPEKKVEKVKDKKENDKDKDTKVIPKINRSEAKQNNIKTVSNPKIGIKEIIFLISAGLVLLGALLWVFFMLYRCVSIYNETENGHFEFLGRQWIKRKEEQYEVVISKHIWLQCNTTHFCFVFCKIFARRHKDQNVLFTFPEDQYECAKIDNKIEFDICSMR